MAKKKTENSSADHTFRALSPKDFTYPEGLPADENSPDGQAEWASVRSRQAGTFSLIEKQREIDRLRTLIKEDRAGSSAGENELEDLVIGGQ